MGGGGEDERSIREESKSSKEGGCGAMDISLGDYDSGPLITGNNGCDGQDEAVMMGSEEEEKDGDEAGYGKSCSINLTWRREMRSLWVERSKQMKALCVKE